jgi:hypothetical protein
MDTNPMPRSERAYLLVHSSDEIELDEKIDFAHDYSACTAPWCCNQYDLRLRHLKELWLGDD